MDDGPAPQALHVLLGLVQAALLLRPGWRTLHQLDKVMTVNFVHDAKHPAAVVADPLQVLAFAGVRLSCGWGGGGRGVSRGCDLSSGRDKLRRAIRCTMSHLISRRCL